MSAGPPRSSSPSLFTAPPAAPGAITAHCDGGARGNPGPAGYGAQITDSDGSVLAELSEFLGVRTNNFAEYSGLLASLDYALTHKHPDLRVISDSELMVKQIQGKYKVNSPDLKPLWLEAKKRIAQLRSFEIGHALRHKNKAADRLANEAMDRGMGRGTPPEQKPTVRSGAAFERVESLPLRAVPYPQTAPAPPRPSRIDPAPRTAPAPDPSAPDRPAAPAMFRGFTRDGVIHPLGGHTLPDGQFVKIILE